jgi:hypothetical protein
LKYFVIVAFGSHGKGWGELGEFVDLEKSERAKLQRLRA